MTDAQSGRLVAPAHLRLLPNYIYVVSLRPANVGTVVVAFLLIFLIATLLSRLISQKLQPIIQQMCVRIPAVKWVELHLDWSCKTTSTEKKAEMGQEFKIIAIPTLV